jgi:hypothetical protein
MIEDMTVRKFTLKTQNDYIRVVKNFTIFLGRSPDTASNEAHETGGKVAMLLNLASLCHPLRTALWQQKPPARIYAASWFARAASALVRAYWLR